MKQITSILLVAAGMSVLGAQGQDAKSTSDAKDSQAVLESPPKKATEEKKAAVIPPTKSTNAILSKPVVYGGYFTDFVKAERKRRLFDLSAPLDPQKDLENLSFNPGIEKVQGPSKYTSPVIILFSIKH